MEIIECELQRYDEWKDDMEKRRRQFETTTGLVLFPSTNCDNSNTERKIKLTDDIWNSDGPLDYEAKRRSDESSIRISDGEVKRMKDELEKSRKRFKSLTKKQEQLLRGTNFRVLFIVQQLLCICNGVLFFYSCVLFIIEHRRKYGSREKDAQEKRHWYADKKSGSSQ